MKYCVEIHACPNYLWGNVIYHIAKPMHLLQHKHVGTYSAYLRKFIFIEREADSLISQLIS